MYDPIVLIGLRHCSCGIAMFEDLSRQSRGPPELRAGRRKLSITTKVCLNRGGGGCSDFWTLNSIAVEFMPRLTGMVLFCNEFSGLGADI